MACRWGVGERSETSGSLAAESNPIFGLADNFFWVGWMSECPPMRQKSIIGSSNESAEKDIDSSTGTRFTVEQ